MDYRRRAGRWDWGDDPPDLIETPTRLGSVTVPYGDIIVAYGRKIAIMTPPNEPYWRRAGWLESFNIVGYFVLDQFKGQVTVYQNGRAVAGRA